MDPNSQQPMNLDQNPFEAILAQKGQSQGGMPMMDQGQGAPMMPPPQPAAGGGPGGAAEMMMPDQLQPGKTGDNTKPLLMAIQALHNYIAASSDQDTIQLVRNFISTLTQLVARDQKMAEQVAQQQAAQGPAQGAAPAGAPSGPPTMS